MNPNNILIIGPSWVGDMVMAQSLFKLLKQRQPQTHIDVLAPAWSQPLLACMPEIRQSYVSPFVHGELNIAGRYQLGKHLQAQQYQQAIVLPNAYKTALIPFFAGIPQRTGWLGEMRWGLLNDVRYLDKQKYPLMVERYAALALPAHENLEKAFAWPALVVDRAEQLKILNKFNLTRDQRPVLGICPGAEYGPAKRWPTQHFAKIVEKKTQEGWQVWIFGSPKDSPLAAEIQQMCENKAVDLTGKTSLGEVIHLMESVQAVVSNDSGLMHIAAALNKPLVAIYGSTPPSFAPPLSTHAEIVSLRLSCSPCFKRECPLLHLKCLRELQPERILAALQNVRM